MVLLAFLLVLCICMGVFQTPMADDYWYALHVHPFWSFFKFEYFGWTGRIFNSFFMFFATGSWTTYFLSGILTGCSLFASAYGITACALARFPRIWEKAGDCLLFLLVFASIWFIIPDLGETCFWKAGYGSYLGPATLAFWFLFPYIHALHHSENRRKSTWLSYTGFAVFGFLAGSAQEQFAVCVGAAVFFILIGLLIQRKIKSIPLSLFAGYAAFVIGAAVLLFAPGNAVREKSISKVANTHSLNQILSLTNQFLFQKILKWEFLWPLLLLIGLSLVLTAISRIKGYPTHLPWKSTVFWLLISSISIMLLVYTGTQSIELSGTRIFFTFLVFLVLAVASLFRVAAKQANTWHPTAIRVADVVFTAVLLIPLLFAVKSSFYLLAQFDVRDQLITAAKERKENDITVPPLFVQDARVTFFGGDGADAWMDQVAQVYHVRSIRTDPAFMYEYQEIHPRVYFWRFK